MYKHRVLFKIPNPYAPERKREWGMRNLIAVHLTTDEQSTGFQKLEDGSYNFHSVSKWILQIVLGTGAGYIYGRTLYLARHLNRASAAQYRHPSTKSWEQVEVGKPTVGGRPAWQFGLTKNANIIPYVDGCF
jgi:hypothetical protein